MYSGRRLISILFIGVLIGGRGGFTAKARKHGEDSVLSSEAAATSPR
jgi:hypothetical protein